MELRILKRKPRTDTLMHTLLEEPHLIFLVSFTLLVFCFAHQ